MELARKIFGSLEGKKVLLVGAGKMSEQAARHLVGQGAGAVLVEPPSRHDLEVEKGRSGAALDDTRPLRAAT